MEDECCVCGKVFQYMTRDYNKKEKKVFIQTQVYIDGGYNLVYSGRRLTSMDIK